MEYHDMIVNRKFLKHWSMQQSLSII
jgi:hypothetical protein